MTFSEDDLIPLKKALISGTKSVSIGDRTVTFQDISELKKLINDIEAKIAQDADPDVVPTQPRTIQATWTKS